MFSPGESMFWTLPSGVGGGLSDPPGGIDSHSPWDGGTPRGTPLQPTPLIILSFVVGLSPHPVALILPYPLYPPYPTRPQGNRPGLLPAQEGQNPARLGEHTGDQHGQDAEAGLRGTCNTEITKPQPENDLKGNRSIDSYESNL